LRTSFLPRPTTTDPWWMRRFRSDLRFNSSNRTLEAYNRYGLLLWYTLSAEIFMFGDSLEVEKQTLLRTRRSDCNNDCNVLVGACTGGNEHVVGVRRAVQPCRTGTQLDNPKYLIILKKMEYIFFFNLDSPRTPPPGIDCSFQGLVPVRTSSGLLCSYITSKNPLLRHFGMVVEVAALIVAVPIYRKRSYFRARWAK
jgi:hypothetical protein